MKLDRSLNMVVPVERSDGTMAYIHATPISRDVFNQFFLVIAKTFTAIYAEGLGPIAGPRVAGKLLKKVAADMGQADQVENGLMAEVRRLINVIAPGSPTLPIAIALAQGVIDQDDVEEAENAIVFFMLVSAMHKKRDVPAILEGAVALWGAQTTSSTCTEYASSLPTLTPAAATGPKAPRSSIPS